MLLSSTQWNFTPNVDHLQCVCYDFLMKFFFDFLWPYFYCCVVLMLKVSILFIFEDVVAIWMECVNFHHFSLFLHLCIASQNKKQQVFSMAHEFLKVYSYFSNKVVWSRLMLFKWLEKYANWFPSKPANDERESRPLCSSNIEGVEKTDCDKFIFFDCVGYFLILFVWRILYTYLQLKEIKKNMKVV